MKILIDMNLSPDWREVFAKHDWESVHWSKVANKTNARPLAIVTMAI